MYKCLDCESVFDESDVLVVNSYVGDYGSEPVYEPWNACPFCESTEIVPFDPDDDFDDDVILTLEEDEYEDA